MKLTISLATLFFVFTFANVSAQWLNGGNTWVTEQIFGTLSNHDIPFWTANTERMRLTTNGDLGLGLNTPMSRFHMETGVVDNWFQMTNQFSGNGSNDQGFTITNHASDGLVWIANWENSPVQFITFDGALNGPVLRAEFTSGQSMIENLLTATPTDGFRIWNPGYASSATTPFEALDLWTGESSTTHIRWDGSGLIQGVNLRFEQFARLDGFWFNAAPLAHQTGHRGNYRYHIDSLEVMRIGNASNSTRGFTRIGLVPSSGPVDAARRLEVYDNSNFPQLRLTHDDALNFADFLVEGSGDLIITPEANGNPARVGIGTNAPGGVLGLFADGQAGLL